MDQKDIREVGYASLIDLKNNFIDMGDFICLKKPIFGLLAVHVVPFAGGLDPAGLHVAAAVEIIPVASDLLPARDRIVTHAQKEGPRREKAGFSAAGSIACGFPGVRRFSRRPRGDKENHRKG